MDDATCAVVRRLYFVDRWPVDTIADELGLTEREVYQAVVLPGADGDIDVEAEAHTSIPIHLEPQEHDL